MTPGYASPASLHGTFRREDEGFRIRVFALPIDSASPRVGAGQRQATPRREVAKATFQNAFEIPGAVDPVGV